MLRANIRCRVDPASAQKLDEQKYTPGNGSSNAELVLINLHHSKGISLEHSIGETKQFGVRAGTRAVVL